MKKILLILALLVMSFNKTAFSQENYDNIYEKMPTINIEYWQSEDPYELTDSMEYYVSPYPLLRLSEPLQNKKIKLDVGFYILSPRNEDGYDFVMFKQQGKIKALVPVYEKVLINPDVVYPKIEKPQKPKKTVKQVIVDNTLFLPFKIIKLPFVVIKKGICAILPERKPPKPYRSKLDAFYVDGGKYLQMNLYVEEYLYKMLFKTDTL